jgi:RNA polymerase sigma factor (sigma-70 family)
MNSVSKSNLDLSKELFHQLQAGSQHENPSIAYHRLTRQVVYEIKLVLQSMNQNRYLHPVDKQELIAETIAKFWIELPKLKYDNLNAWLMRTWKNTFIDSKRRGKKIRLASNLNVFEVGYDPAQVQSLQHNKELQVQVLEHFLSQLTENQRFTFTQNKLEQMSLQELGASLDVVPNTLSQRHARILDELRQTARPYKHLFLND